MPAYSFKINMELGNGTQLSYYNSTFANSSGSVYIEAPQIVTWINNMPLANEYIESEEGVPVSTTAKFSTEGSTYLSASFTGPANPGDAESGSVVFTDTETTTRGGLKRYTFWGTKVCSVLGLPEGIPIYPENFKLSDDEDDPNNYMSGDVIANGVSVKESFKLTNQARVKGNLVWDQVFGEGYVQWVSGSTSDLRIGYEPDKNVYEIVAGTVQMNVEGIDELGATNITASGHINVTDYVTALGGIHVGGTSDPGTDNLFVDGYTYSLGGLHVGGTSDPGDDNLVVDGNITVDGTVDSRDIASDGVKLDTIEQNADVTDTTNVTAAGALMDSELTDESAVKGIDQALTSTSSPTFSDLTIAGSLIHSGDTDTKIVFGTNDISFEVGAQTFMDMNNGSSPYSLIINEGSDDMNFRVENNVNTYGLYSDGGRSNVIIGNNASLPSLILDSTSSGDDWTAEGAQIVIGESAVADGIDAAPSTGHAALYITYRGNGYGYIGMGGTDDGTAGIPNQGYIRWYYAGTGVYVGGSLSKSSGTFTIKHPDPAKSGSMALQHSFVESPTRGDNIYTYVVSSSADNQTVVTDLPSYWEFLNENPRMWIQAKGMFAQAYGEVSSSLKQFSVTMEKAGSYEVMIIGTRKDPDAVRDWEGIEVSNSVLFPTMQISEKINNTRAKYSSSFDNYTNGKIDNTLWTETSSSLASQIVRLQMSQSLNITGSDANPPWKDEL